MSGGTTHTTQNANGHVAFNPTSIGGGNISVGGSVGQAGVQQSSSGSATGAGVKLDVSVPMPAILMNLGNNVVFLRAAGETNFKGGPGKNTVHSMDATAGSVTNFGLVNLDNDDIIDLMNLDNYYY